MSALEHAVANVARLAARPIAVDDARAIAGVLEGRILQSFDGELVEPVHVVRVAVRFVSEVRGPLTEESVRRWLAARQTPSSLLRLAEGRGLARVELELAALAGDVASANECAAIRRRTA